MASKMAKRMGSRVPREDIINKNKLSCFPCVISSTWDGDMG